MRTTIDPLAKGKNQAETGPYAGRWIRFLKHWQRGDTTFKVYEITMGAGSCSKKLLDAALASVAKHLRDNSTRHRQYGVGFISLHVGRGENQIVIDRWINENELLHQILVSSEKTPASFRKPPRDHNSVCVWELYLQGFERKAWLDCVLRSRMSWPARLRKYLDQRLDVRV